MAAASTDNCFRDDNKGGLFSRRAPYLPSKIGPRGAPLYREDGAGEPHFIGKMGPGGGPNKGGPKIL